MKNTITLSILSFVLSHNIYAQIDFEYMADLTGIADGHIAFADVDGDSDEDVLITGSTDTGDITELYTNDGSGNFTLVNNTPFPGVWLGYIAFGDVDGDSDQDVFLTGQSGSGPIANLYTNDGNGNFTLMNNTPFPGVYSGSVALDDVDGDNDKDVLITGLSASGFIAKLYTNDGNGNYTLVNNTPFPGVSDGHIGFADLDGDGPQELLITGTSFGQPVAKLYTNNGSGNYTELTFVPIGGGIGSFEFADVDSDNDLDLVTIGTSSSTTSTLLYINDGTGNLTLNLGQYFDGVKIGSIAFADVDGDTDQDLLVTGSTVIGTRVAKLYSNDGNGNFVEENNMPFPGVRFSSVAFADVDGDAKKDVLITGESSSGRISKLYLNKSICGVMVTQTTVNETTISSNAVGANYQWLDCDNSMDIILGETGPTYTASENGSYAVEVTQNGCVDTSACVAITTVSIIENSFADKFTLYPNPTSGGLTITFDKIQEALTLRLLNLSGQLIEESFFEHTQDLQMHVHFPSGIYLLEVLDDAGNKALVRVLKE